MTICDIKDGGHFIIKNLTAIGEIRRRLTDMGFIRGTQGMVLREALLKDPIELFLKGYRVSVRRAEAQQIHVEELK